MYSIIVTVLCVVLLSERIAKLIPDSSTGVLGFARKVFKIVALYTENIR